MRRAFGIGSIVVVVGIGALIGFTAYQAGINEGIQRGADASQVVEVVRGPGAGLGFLALPLLLFAGLALVGGAKRRWARGYGRSRHGSGGGFGPSRSWGREEAIAEWHRHLHEPEVGGDPPVTPAS